MFYIEIDRLDSKRFAVDSRDGSPASQHHHQPPPPPILLPPPPPPPPLPLMVLGCSVPISGDLLNFNSVLVRRPRFSYEVYATTSAKAWLYIVWPVLSNEHKHFHGTTYRIKSFLACNIY
ncbi:hypothetical protein HZH68_006675 [Vespula germanica]|uniref:Uncharacterized protein n=1 Tax=Vespula germanica TaxID=30212 RepID=A0A834KBV5_VESGE|nr:hypothetical protein HZH68_006675 [Vespula germanica]